MVAPFEADSSGLNALSGVVSTGCPSAGKPDPPSRCRRPEARPFRPRSGDAKRLDKGQVMPSPEPAKRRSPRGCPGKLAERWDSEERLRIRARAFQVPGSQAQARSHRPQGAGGQLCALSTWERKRTEREPRARPLGTEGSGEQPPKMRTRWAAHSSSHQEAEAGGVAGAHPGSGHGFVLPLRGVPGI